ncbi:hypothetical protein F5B21DRAFT_521736 [Xylaria acuta]|nr:hypothetical protein F5B21DRAFT_521736 [Xylaria acuta]
MPSDVLRDQAPGPNAYRNKTEEQQDAAQGNNVIYELAGSNPQEDRHSAQQHERQTEETSRLGLSHPVREGDLEAYRLPNGGQHNRSVPTSMASKLYVRQTSSHPYTRNIRKNTLESLAGDLGRSVSVMANKYHATGLQNYVGMPIQQGLPRREPQHMYRHETPSQVPIINLQAYEPSPLSSPGSVRSGPRQFPSPVIETSSGNIAAPKLLAESDTLGKRPIGPRPMDVGLYVSANANREGRLSTVNTATSNQGHSPLPSEQAEPEPSYRSSNDAQLRRRSIPFNIASSLNGIHQDTSNRSPAPLPQTCLVSTPNQIHLRYPATAPRPLELPNSDQHYVPHTHTAYKRRKMIPQPRLLSHEPPIYEVEEEGEDIPKVPVRALGWERMQRLRGGGQHRPRVPQRGSSRKFKRKTPNASRGMGVVLKGKNVISDSV